MEPGLKSLEIVNVLRKFPRRYSYKFRLHDGHIPEGKNIILNYEFLDDGNFHLRAIREHLFQQTVQTR